MTRQSTRLTQADEEKMINFEIYRFRLKMFKMNKDLKYYQVTGVTVTHSEMMMAPVRMHWDLFGRVRDWMKKRRLKAVNEKNKET